jgi:SPP1 family predicted phage head-tail adaptor
MTAPGDLNRRLLLEAPVETDDGVGGVTRLYDVVTMLWAQVLPLSAAAAITADNLGGSVRYRIVVRARADITTRHRFQDGARIYRILALRQSADRRFLEIEAEERDRQWRKFHRRQGAPHRLFS